MIVQLSKKHLFSSIKIVVSSIEEIKENTSKFSYLKAWSRFSAYNISFNCTKEPKRMKTETKSLTQLICQIQCNSWYDYGDISIIACLFLPSVAFASS